jgi:hypothetical protein
VNSVASKLRHLACVGALLLLLGGCFDAAEALEENIPVEDDVAGGIHPPAPSPTPTPTGTGGDEKAGIAAVADGLDVPSLLSAIPAASSNAPDVVGAFRFLCPPSHISYDDPIVHPGQPGANEHLHIFFGNTGTNANSTYQSLRQSGDSTCRNMLNRSAYWQPAMIGKNTSGQDVVVVEDYTNFYYKRRPEGDPKAEGIPVALPRGLKFVFGGMEHPARFKCMTADGNHNVTNWLPTLQETLAVCGAGQRIDMAQSTPECWDGIHLDTADHRSHLVFLSRDKNTGKEFCPSTHPYLLPRLTFQRIFTIRADDITTTWRLSSDMPGDVPGSMAHADYMMAWNDQTMDRWMSNCINKLLTCSDGNLGDGSRMAANSLYKNGMAQSARRTPVPARGQVISLLSK